MDFTFTEDQLLFRDSVRDFLQQEVSPAAIRQQWQSETGRSESLWQQLAELGLTSLLVPQACGGLGLNELDFVLLAQECGRVALPEPLVNLALVVTPLLASLASDNKRCADLLAAIAAGETIVSIGHNTNKLVSDAHIAAWLLLPDGDDIHLLPREQVSITAQPSVDPSRRLFSVAWQPAKASLLCGGPHGADLLAAALNRGALGVAAQLLGLAEAMVQRTVQYTAERKQFGRPVGSNQALKHAMANCAVKTEFAKPVVYAAAYSLTGPAASADPAVSHAKISAGESALLAARNSIQCHGAMGYTWECDLHIFMKRAWALNNDWGPVGFHKNRLYQWLLNTDTSIGADQTFSLQTCASF